MIKNPLTGEPLLEHQEVAKLLGVHRNTIYNWVQHGIIPVIRIGRRRTRIPQWQLQEWINKTFGGGNMLKMTEEEVKRYYEKEPKRDAPPGDIEQLEGEALLDEMEMRSTQALAKCAVALDEFYPCFEKTIEVKLHDVKGRIPEQAIGCEVAADLTKSKKRTVPEQKRVERALRNLTRDVAKQRAKSKPENNENA